MAAMFALAISTAVPGLAQDASPAAPAGEPGTIGLIFNAAADPNQQAIAAGLDEVASAAGWTITSVDANADAAAANDLMNTMVTRQVDAIVFITFDPASLQSGIAAANAANIPVYAIGSGYGQPEGLSGATRQDAGTVQTQTMIDDMGGGTDGAVLAFTYRAGAPCAISEGRFDEVMAQHPDVEVTKADVNNPSASKFGEDTAAAWLQSHPAGEQPLAIWGCYDGPNLGALVALRAAGRNDVKIYGAYGQPEAIKAIQDGEYTATWFFDLRSDGERVAQDILSGTYSPTNQDLYETQTVKVDASTVEQFIQDFPYAAPQ